MPALPKRMYVHVRLCFYVQFVAMRRLVRYHALEFGMARKPKRTTQEVPTATQTPYRGKERSENGSLTRITVTLPDDLLERTDLHVLERRRDARAYNRSALIEEALRAMLDAK